MDAVIETLRAEDWQIASFPPKRKEEPGAVLCEEPPKE
jgi:hypothetical protein